MKPLTRILLASGTTISAIATSHIALQWYRMRKVAKELRSLRLLKHPLWDIPRIWRYTQPIYSVNHPQPRTTTTSTAGVTISSQNIAGYQGGPTVMIRTYEPTTKQTDDALLWIHGGGFILGNPETDDTICTFIARSLGCNVISPDYRLAGTAPFPAALHDCHATYTWLRQHYPAENIIVAGHSAGGGLAACLVQWLYDDQNAPGYQLLLEPMLDDRTRVTPHPGRGEFIWNHTENEMAWNCYLSHLSPRDEIPNYAVAARRLDLTGLPHTFITVGDIDLFYEETQAYVRRCKEHDVAVESVILPGAYHGAVIDKFTAPMMQELWAKIFASITSRTNNTPK